MTMKLKTPWRTASVGLAVLVIGQFLAVAQASETLVGLFERAKVYDAEYQAAIAARDAGVQSREIGRSVLLPDLSFSSTYSRSNLDRTYSNGSPPLTIDGKPQSYVFSLSQPLINFSKMASFREETARADLAEANFRDATIQLTLRVARSYFDTLLAADQLKLAREQRKAYSAQRMQTEKMRQAGILSVTDVADTQAREMNSVAVETEAEFGLKLRRAELARIVGGGPREIDLTPVADFEPADPMPNDLNHWLEVAGQASPKIQAAQMALEVARQGAKRADADFLPSLDLVGQTSKTANSNSFTDSEDGSSIGIRLSVPLYQGGRTTALSQRAIAVRAQTEAQLDNIRRETAVKVTESFLGVGNAKAKINALSLAFKAAELGLRGATAGRDASVKTQVDVLNAIQQTAQVGRDLNRERYNYLLAGLQLRAFCGDLQDRDLILPVEAPATASKDSK